MHCIAALLAVGHELVEYEVLVAQVHVELLHAVCQVRVCVCIICLCLCVHVCVCVLAQVHVELLRAVCQVCMTALNVCAYPPSMMLIHLQLS